MSEEKEQYLITDSGWGGARVAGPGKKIGRPTKFDKRVAVTFKLPSSLVSKLKGEENQTGLIVRLLAEYYGIAEP